MDAQAWKNCSVAADNGNLIPTLTCLPPLIAAFVNWALIAAGVIAIFIVVYAGYKYINSSGDPKQADTARKTLMYAVFGLFLIFMAFFVVRAIGQITGLDKNCYTNFGFTNCNAGATLNPNSPADQTPCLASGSECSSSPLCCSKNCRFDTGNNLNKCE